MNCSAPATTKRETAQGDELSEMQTTENLSQEPGIPLFALCWLGVAAVAMIAWTGALAWGAWRLADWLLA
jgi:hypothetical protein